jgi:hypothetical protein
MTVRSFAVLAVFAIGCAAPAADADLELSAQAVTDACNGAVGIGTVAWGDVLRVAEVETTGTRELHLAVAVDDAAIARTQPAYDGASERVFACVAQRPGPFGTGPRYAKVDLAWQETYVAGGRTFDLHGATIPSSSVLLRGGVYFGIETAGGILWAQRPGEDLSIRPLLGLPKTERPQP